MNKLFIMKLTYFNCRGLAETSRILLAVANAKYTDQRYPLKLLDSETHTFEKEAFDRDKASGKLARSLNKVPFLEVDGKILPQSKSIERYLAKRYNLMGSNDFEAAQIDSICEYVRDFKTEYQKTRALKGDERVMGMTKWFTETLPKRLCTLDLIVGQQFAIGDKLSLADIVLFSFGTQFFDDTERATAAFNQTVNIKAAVERIQNLSQVKAWLSMRPVTDF